MMIYIVFFKKIYIFILVYKKKLFTNWNYSCDSKVSFDRVQILTPDFLGRRSPPSSFFPFFTSFLPTSPPFFLFVFFLSSLFLLPSSFFLLRKFDFVLSSFFGMRLTLRILRPHSFTLILSLSYCLIDFFIFLSSLSLLCLSSFYLSSFSSFSSFAGGSGQRATYKGLFTPASKKSAVFFLISLLCIFSFWSASFPPLGLNII